MFRPQLRKRKLGEFCTLICVVCVGLPILPTRRNLVERSNLISFCCLSKLSLTFVLLLTMKWASHKVSCVSSQWILYSLKMAASSSCDQVKNPCDYKEFELIITYPTLINKQCFHFSLRLCSHLCDKATFLSTSVLMTRLDVQIPNMRDNARK